VARSVLIVLALAGVLSAHGAAGASPATLYVSTTGFDGGGCTRTAPCRSFDAAFKVASPSTHVIVAGGHYPQQTVSARDRGGPPVVFAPAPGAKVVIADELNVFASHAEFADMTVSDWYVRDGATDLTFRRMKVQLFFIRSASRIRVLGGSVGGVDSGAAPTIGATYQSHVPSRDVLLDGVSFHDVTRRQDPSGHVQCLFVQSVDGLVVRNSTFRHCDVFDVYVNNIGVGPVPKNVLFENDLFDKASDGGFYSLFVRNDPGDTIDGLIVRYSSFLQGPHFDAGSYTHSRVVANVAPFTNPQCTKGLTFAHNVFDEARCGPTDRRARLGYVDPAALRLGLKAGSAAIDAGDAKDFPQRDIRGRRRPRGKAPDAGAYESA
jgi:hypothetical protein